MFPSAVPPAEDRAPIPSRPEQAAPSTMRIERLEIVGFKSFAEPVTIEFHGGATAIVGPNGCGKSNLVDAVAWVRGELGARTIRARGRDLLFSGSADRSPHQVAEVRLAVSGGA